MLTFENLGEDILNKIFGYNDFEDQLQFSKVCFFTHKNKIKFGYNNSKKISIWFNNSGSLIVCEKNKEKVSSYNYLISSYIFFYMSKKKVNHEYKNLLAKSIDEITVTFEEEMSYNNLVLGVNTISLINECYKLSILRLNMDLFTIEKIKFGNFLKDIYIYVSKGKKCLNINLSSCILLKQLEICSFGITKFTINNIHFNHVQFLNLKVKEFGGNINDIKSILIKNNSIKHLNLEVSSKSLILLNLMFLNNLHTIKITVQELYFFPIKNFAFLLNNQKMSNEVYRFKLDLFMNNNYILYKNLLEQLHINLNKVIERLNLSIKIFEKKVIPLNLSLFKIIKDSLLKLFKLFKIIEIPHIYIERSLKPTILNFFQKNKIYCGKIEEKKMF